MHLMRMNLGGIPPFTEPIQLKFDERVNLFVGPNASGKSTILLVLADRLIGPEEDAKRPISKGETPLRVVLSSDDEFDEFLSNNATPYRRSNVLTVSEDWIRSREEPSRNSENPPVIFIGSLREGMPGISDQDEPDAFGKTAAEALDGPFSGSRTMSASRLLTEELWSTNRDDLPNFARVTLMDAMELADACSQHICGEVIRDSRSHNYIPDPYALRYLLHQLGDPKNITVLQLMGIDTTDVRNFDSLPHQEQPASSVYTDSGEPIPIYLGHLSSGTEGTLLWIRWLALKMVHFYGFERDWAAKPAILLIDEIENHLHPTWQRRVIPALLKHFPALQIFATTHSPFVVAGLKAGQVHLLKRDAEGRVTATTNTEDIIGWTADEILRTMMGVVDPTDDATADAASKLRQLRQQGPSDTLEAEEQRQLRMIELRQKVDRDLLAGGPWKARREEFEQQFAEALEQYRRSQNLGQDDG